MRRKPVKEDKKEKIAIVTFLVCIILTGFVYYYLWQGQTFGRTAEGVLKLAQIWEKRKALESEQPVVTAIYDMDATNGCCVWLERPSMASQLVLNVPQGSFKCYEDPIVRQQVSRGYVIVDITSGRCPR